MINEEMILEQLTIAVEEIRKAVAEYDKYVDDCSWGNDRFMVKIFDQNGDCVNYFYFIYDSDEDLYGTLEQQVDKKLDEFLEIWR